MKKKRLPASIGSFCIILMIVMLTLMTDCTDPATIFAASDKAPEKIRIGCAIALSGANAIAAGNSQVTEYKLWVEQANAKGGIFVKKYNKRIPVELVIYDDHSEIETCVKMVEKLILQDKVHFMLPPWGTAFNFAVAPVANKYQHIMIGSMVSSGETMEKLAKTPYFFVILNQPGTIARSTVELLQDVGVKSAGIIHIADLFGIEHTAALKPLIAKTNIKLAMIKSYPLGATDLSPLINTLQAENVDAVIVNGYPDSTWLLTKQMTALGYNPKYFQNGIGTQFIDYKDAFGSAGIEGVIGQGVINPKMPYPGLKAFFEAYKKMYGKECARGGEAGSYSVLQVMEQAIEKVGSLDRPKIREVIAKETFNTIIGPVKFEGGCNINFPGDLGQWQNGEFECVSPKAKRTAQPLYPKPKWPTPK